MLMDAWLENQRQEKVSVGWVSALVGPLEAISQFRGGFSDWLMAKPLPPKTPPTGQSLMPDSPQKKWLRRYGTKLSP